MLFPAY